METIGTVMIVALMLYAVLILISQFKDEIDAWRRRRERKRMRHVVGFDEWWGRR